MLLQLCFGATLLDERGTCSNQMLLPLVHVCCNMTLHDDRGEVLILQSHTKT